MSVQSKWHTDFFSYNSTQKYSVDHREQNLTKEQLEQDPELFEKIKDNYRKSEELYSSAKLHNELLTRVINDPGSNAYSDKTKELILEKKTDCLKPIMVSAFSATRDEMQDLEKELAKNDERYTIIKTRIANAKEKAENIIINKIKEGINKEKVKSYFEAIYDFLKYLFTFSPSQFIQWMSELNLYRLSYTFPRISLKQLFTLLQSLGIINSKGKFQGIFINTSRMDYPTPVFNLLSVLIFAVKIISGLSLIIKHAINPTSYAELAFGIGTRAKKEFMRLWDVFANDIFWLTFNLITNYSLLFKIPIPIANWILTGALLFDITLLSIILFNKDKQLAAEILWLGEQIELAKENNSEEHVEMYQAMIDQAKIMRAGIRTTFLMCIFATTLFIASLALTFSLATPLMAPIGFFACVVAVAIILSRREIGAYAEARAAKSIYANHKETSDIVDARNKNVSKTGLQLAKSLAEHIFIPMIIIGLYTISLEAAIAATALYVCVKVSGVKLTNFENKNKPKELAFEDEAPLCAPALR